MGHRHRALTGGAARGAARLMSVLLMLIAAPAAGAGPAPTGPRLVWQLAEPARGIPARDGQSAYFLTHRHELLAASMTSGRVRWRVPMTTTATTFGSRVIVRGDVVVAGDYDLMGVDRRTGRHVWTFVAADGGGSGMHLGEPAGELVFSGSLAGSLHAVVAATGRPRWSVRIGNPDSTTVYSPVVQGGLVAAAFTDFGPTPAGGVVVADISTGRVRWRRTVVGSVGASGNPVFAGECVIVASRDGTVHAIRISDGAHLWTLPKVASLADEQDYRPLAVSGRTLIAGSLSGEVSAWDLVTRRVRWRRTPTVASVAFSIGAANDVVYVPTFSNQIVALRVHDGAELWRLGGGGLQFRWLPLVDGPLLLASGSQSFSLFRHNGAGARGGR
jgi:outer membrane protein assembly factor BamB